MGLTISTGYTNSTRLRLVQFHALPVPVTRAINPPAYCTLNRVINYTYPILPRLMGDATGMLET